MVAADGYEEAPMVVAPINGHLARTLRIAAAIACPPALAIAYDAYCANVWYALLLAYAPMAGGAIGLMSRPVLDAAKGRGDPRYEFSGKGAIAGAVAVFLIVLAFAASHVDRSALTAIFAGSGLLYYAVGKCGCYFLGCCRAVEARAIGIPLPLVEAACAALLAIGAFASTAASPPVRVDAFATIVAALLAVRVYSRVARGAAPATALKQLDSLLLIALFAYTIAASLWMKGSLP